VGAALAVGELELAGSVRCRGAVSEVLDPGVNFVGGGCDVGMS
jgi:hypothetical protein